MFIMTGHTAKLEDLPMFQGIRTNNGEVGAIMFNRAAFTHVLRPDGSVESIHRETIVEVLVPNYDIVVAGLRQLEQELKNETHGA